VHEYDDDDEMSVINVNQKKKSY